MEFGRQQSPSSRLTGLGFVVLFHIALIYGLIYGLSHNKISIPLIPIETKIIKEVKPPPPPPPPPSVTIPPPPPVYIPPPEVNIAQPVQSTNAIAAVTTTKAPPPPPVVAPVAQVRVPPDTNVAKNCPNQGQFDFPSASERLGEHGTTQIAFLVDVTGHVVDSKIEKSSGSTRLDDATQQAIKRCKFKPGTVDGKPEQAWGRVAYVWKLPN